MEPIDPRVNPALVPDGSKATLIAEQQQDKYKILPSVRTPTGYVITRWNLSEEERYNILHGQDIYVTILSNGPINPLFVTVGPVNWNH